MDLTKALAPKSDQLDAADLIGSPPQVFTITGVAENKSALADQQPVNVRLAEFPRVWRPSKGMLRVLADNWGKDVTAWVGRKVELYGDPEVYFGTEKRGGTRISRLSHISARKSTLVNPRGGRGSQWTVEPLPEAPTKKPEPVEVRAPKAIDWYAAKGVTKANLEAHVGKPVAEWTAADLDALLADSDQLSALPQSGADIDPNARVA